MNEFILDGNNFNDIKGFYNEIGKLLTKDLDWEIGHNLDALNDLLRGGFGVHEYGAPVIIKWKNYDKSKVDIGAEMMLAILEVILDFDNSGHNCKLELYP